MSEDLAPSVVAVVVTSDPECCFEACLASLSRQDYTNLSVLVVDDRGEADLTCRVASALPSAFLRRRSARGGYAAAADEALVGVSGAAFLLFLHDDVELEATAVSRLVEESFRSNAAVVGPKMVSAADPSVLLNVGMGMHPLGAPVPRVEVGELDQSQHDEAREVFAVPSGCMLVRSDLFAALGGFDVELEGVGEDVDFCWRAQLAGARVAVAPRARVRHLERSCCGDLAGSQGSDLARLERRHELRSVLKNYGYFRRAIALMALVALGFFQAAVSVGSRERRRECSIGGALLWNLRHWGSLRAERRRIRELRQVRDGELARRMSGRSRAGPLMEELPAKPDLIHQRSFSEAQPDRLSRLVSELRSGAIPTGRIVAAGAIAVAAFVGMRDVLFAHLPLLGQFAPMPTGRSLFADFFGGLPHGHAVAPAPAAYGIVGLLALVLGNSSALALKVLCVAALAAGAFGTSVLCRPFLSPRGRITAAAVFAASPLAWNAIATGNLRAAVGLATMPFILSRLGRATGLAPFGLKAPYRSPLRAGAAEAAPLGLLVALAVALAPSALLALVAAGSAVLVSCLLAGARQAALRAAEVLGAALAVAWCCLLPWSLTFFTGRSSMSALTGAVPSAATSPASLLKGHLGPVGNSLLAYGLVVAASYALFVARRERLRWAGTLWLAAIFSAALAWAGSKGWLGPGGGDSAVLAATASVGLAASCGLGVAAFERDVVGRSSFGWRHVAAAAAALCLVAGALPALVAAIGGHDGLPSEDTAQTLGLSAGHSGRSATLWIGDPRALPTDGWQLQRGVSWLVAEHSTPQATEDWPPASQGSFSPASKALRLLLSDRTDEVGALLAPVGIRYIVVPTADAPALPGTESSPLRAPPPAALLSSLQAQQDLVQRPVEAGGYLFVNAAWSPGLPRHTLTAGAAMSPLEREISLAIGLATVTAAVLEGVVRRRRERSRAGPTVPSDDLSLDERAIEVIVAGMRSYDRPREVASR